MRQQTVEDEFFHGYLGQVDVLRVYGGLLSYSLQESVGDVERLQDELADGHLQRIVNMVSENNQEKKKLCLYKIPLRHNDCIKYVY